MTENGKSLYVSFKKHTENKPEHQGSIKVILSSLYPLTDQEIFHKIK